MPQTREFTVNGWGQDEVQVIVDISDNNPYRYTFTIYDQRFVITSYVNSYHAQMFTLSNDDFIELATGRITSEEYCEIELQSGDDIRYGTDIVRLAAELIVLKGF